MKALTTYGLALILTAASGASLAHEQHRPVRHGIHHGRHELHHRLDHQFRHHYNRHNHHADGYYSGYFGRYYPAYGGSVWFAPGVTVGFYHTHHGAACYQDHSRGRHRGHH